MMEKIDLNNYEAWILDYMEGNLSEKEVSLLMSFLEEHPELKEELELDLNDVILRASNEDKIEKAPLLVEKDQLLISAETVDDLMISAVESELSVNEKIQLEQYVAEHDLKLDYKAYQLTKLIPDLSEVMDGKDKMKVRPVIIPLYARVASIAAVGIVLIGLAWNNSSNDPVRGAVSNGDAAYAESLDKQSHETDHNQTDHANFAIHVDPIKKDNGPKVKEEFDWDIPDELIVEEDSRDTIELQKPPEIKFVPEPDRDNSIIVEQVDTSNTNKEIIEDDIAIATIKKEEPYKLITDAAGNFLNRDVSFTRDKNTEEDQYVAYSFKLGNFEFERKKSK